MHQPTQTQAPLHHRPQMKRWRVAIGASMLLVASSLASCSPSSAVTPITGPTAGPAPIETADDLIAALQQATGTSVRDGGAAPSEFGAPGRILLLGDESVEVYAFPDATSRTTAQSEIEPQGPSFMGQPLAGWRHPRIWGAGRLLVVYDGRQGGTFLVLSGLLGDPMLMTTLEPGPDEPYPPAVSSAIGALADAEAIDPRRIGVLSYESAVWPDGCLGLPGGGATCDPGEVDGWQVELTVDGASVEVHTDDLGQRVRWRR